MTMIASRSQVQNGNKLINPRTFLFSSNCRQSLLVLSCFHRLEVGLPATQQVVPIEAVSFAEQYPNRNRRTDEGEADEWNNRERECSGRGIELPWSGRDSLQNPQ